MPPERSHAEASRLRARQRRIAKRDVPPVRLLHGSAPPVAAVRYGVKLGAFPLIFGLRRHPLAPDLRPPPLFVLRPPPLPRAPPPPPPEPGYSAPRCSPPPRSRPLSPRSRRSSS